MSEPEKKAAKVEAEEEANLEEKLWGPSSNLPANVKSIFARSSDEFKAKNDVNLKEELSKQFGSALSTIDKTGKCEISFDVLLKD